MINTLSARIEPISALPGKIQQGMFRLYSSYYAATGFEQFLKDLNGKTHVVLLFDQKDKVRGFSTMERYFYTADTATESDVTQRCQIVFSGDTIIEHEFWGQQVLPMTWIEQSGRFKAEHPDLPLYWFLIVKGYRTYRYLSVFSKEYYPSAEQLASDQLQPLLQRLAIDRFGDDYQPDTGCIVFPVSRGHLSGIWADIPERVRARPEVAFFLHKNPGYYKGHELACMTELSTCNLTRRARIAFERGLNQ